ncbi:MAG TPA: CPBP family intramembrane glutamic endopeptidase [Myxococcales bacterium]|jgi:membrane protease YdiL (CAAX protease family)
MVRAAMTEPQPTAPEPVPVPSPPPPTSPSEAPSPAWLRLWREVIGLLRGLDLPSTVAMLVGMVALVLSHHQGDTWFYRSNFAKWVGEGKEPFYEYLPTLYWHLAAVAFYLLVPLAAAALTPGVRVRELGLGLGDRKYGLKATALVVACFVPVVFAASRLDTFANHYPLCSAAKSSVGLFLAYELSFAAYFIAWEFIFRGYLLFSFEKTMGKAAILAQTMPFVIMHFGKPELETLGSIVAGVALGLLALRTRSMWYGAVIHVAAAFSMDLFATLKALGR